MKFLYAIIIVNLLACNDRRSPKVLPQFGKPSAAMKDDFEFSPQNAHANARKLMNEDFFWSSIEETGPFGSDDGWDAAYTFRQWRGFNKSASPVTFLRELINSWEYPYFDWNEMDTQKIKAVINTPPVLDDAYVEEQVKLLKEIKHPWDTSGEQASDDELRKAVRASSANMPGLYILYQDNAIIGTAFAQFVLEGKTDAELKELAMTAIERQLLPVLIDRYDQPYRQTRFIQLNKMLNVVRQMNES
jgi:uncharacterized protein YfeS